MIRIITPEPMKTLITILLLCSFFSATASDSILSCLPRDITQETLVSSGEPARRAVTVREALGRIGALCEGGKLVDKSGREIHFVHLIGCWGNPPQDYQERLASQDREIKSLKARYTVLEIPCATTNLRTIQ
jgi:hypothetical protein